MSWIALLAILLQTLVPIFHEAPQAAASPFPALVGSLCLAPGSMPPTPGDSDKIPVHKLPPCAICQTVQLLSAGFAPPTMPAIVRPIARAVNTIPLPAAAILVSKTAARPSARAPPWAI